MTLKSIQNKHTLYIYLKYPSLNKLLFFILFSSSSLWTRSGQADEIGEAHLIMCEFPMIVGTHARLQLALPLHRPRQT